MKSVFLIFSALFSTFTSSQTGPITYSFAVDPPYCKSAVIIDSLHCIWDGTTVSYVAKCHSNDFASAKRNVLLRFTMAGTVPHSTIEVARDTTLSRGTKTFEITGSFSYQFEPNLALVFAVYKDGFVTDVIIPEEVGNDFVQQDKQLVIFSEGRQ